MEPYLIFDPHFFYPTNESTDRRPNAEPRTRQPPLDFRHLPISFPPAHLSAYDHHLVRLRSWVLQCLAHGFPRGSPRGFRMCVIPASRGK